MLAFGVHGMSVITAVTAQNSVGVQGVWSLPPGPYGLSSTASWTTSASTGSRQGCSGLPRRSSAWRTCWRSSATPFRSSSTRSCVSKHGDPLIDIDALASVRSRLLPPATVLTPNLGEAVRLAQAGDGTSPEQLAQRLLAYGPRWVLVKGGHGTGDLVDHLAGPDGQIRDFAAGRADNRHTHGTGCTLASAIASRLALGDSVPDAVSAAKHYVTGAIRAGFPLGAGIGPTDHLLQLREHVRADGV